MAIKEYKIASGPRRGITLYEVDGFNFDEKANAEAFEKASWPRQLENGKWVTSDRVAFTDKKLAQEREKNLAGGK